ncbi:MAG: polA, partial [Solirubrobacterales bacterium]|nr:polA [Solirubrobacterales bacterium]
MAEKPDELFLIDGNSLAYRAFFALPESIATSTGFPTNTIFGFASMLVKMLTEHGTKPTIVVWDAGSSGRKEISADYKATRTSRPDLLKQQWPHLEPLVEAFGYLNVSVEGFEADDVIATLAVKARDEGIPVTIVTGDRDAFQLIDPESRIKVMATARGITETKLYDHQAVIDRYGIPPESIPDFYGLKGDTSDNIPGVPGIGDKTAADLLQRFGDLDTVLASVDEISGAKRKENLVNHADDARVSRQLATIITDVPGVETPDWAAVAREPDRSRLREVFREFELRDPLRRLEEFMGEGDAAAPAPAAERTVKAKVREVTLGDLERLPADLPVALAVIAPETVEGELFAREAMPGFGVATGREVLVGEAETPEGAVLALGERPVTAHDAKSLGAVPRNLAHDTLLGAFILEPARRGFPFRELVEERGFAADTGNPAADEALLVRELATWQRDQIEDRGLERIMDEVELPLVYVLRAMEAEGVRLNVERLDEVGRRVRDEVTGLEREIWALADTEFTIGSPQQLGEILFTKLGLSKKRRGKTGFSTDARVLQAIR